MICFCGGLFLYGKVCYNGSKSDNEPFLLTASLNWLQVTGSGTGLSQHIMEMRRGVMEYRFRLAETSECKEIVALYSGAIQHQIEQKIYQWDELYPNEKVLTGDIMNREMYVLTKGAKILACVVLNEEQDLEYQTGAWSYREGRIAVIHRLCVNHTSQGGGFGRLTMEYAEQKIKAEGYSSIRLDTFSENVISRKLYESLGYTYAGTVTFRKGLFYLMEKSCEAIQEDSKKRLEVRYEDTDTR